MSTNYVITYDCVCEKSGNPMFLPDCHKAASTPSSWRELSLPTPLLTTHDPSPHSRPGDLENQSCSPDEVPLRAETPRPPIPDRPPASGLRRAFTDYIAQNGILKMSATSAAFLSWCMGVGTVGSCQITESGAFLCKLSEVALVLGSRTTSL